MEKSEEISSEEISVMKAIDYRLLSQVVHVRCPACIWPIVFSPKKDAVQFDKSSGI